MKIEILFIADIEVREDDPEYEENGTALATLDGDTQLDENSTSITYAVDKNIPTRSMQIGKIVLPSNTSVNNANLHTFVVKMCRQAPEDIIGFQLIAHYIPATGRDSFEEIALPFAPAGGCFICNDGVEQDV